MKEKNKRLTHVLDFFKRQKTILIMMSFFLIIVVALGFWLMYLKEDKKIWLDVIFISLLINIVSSLFIIAFIEDEKKKREEDRQKELENEKEIRKNKKDDLTKIAQKKLIGIKRNIIKIHEEFSDNSLLDQKSIDCFLKKLKEKNIFLDYNYSSTCRHMSKLGINQCDKGNWIEFLYYLLEKETKIIKELSFAYYNEFEIKAFEEIYDLIIKVDKVLIWKTRDIEFVNDSEYQIKKNNGIIIINLLPDIIETIDGILNIFKD